MSMDTLHIGLGWPYKAYNTCVLFIITDDDIVVRGLYIYSLLDLIVLLTWLVLLCLQDVIRPYSSQTAIIKAYLSWIIALGVLWWSKH